MIILKNKKLEEFVGNNVLITEFGIAANTINIDALPIHTKPDQIRDEIPTLNQFGFMKFEWDEFSKEFVDYAKKAAKPVLELGPAYGWVTHRALEQDIRIVAADISKEHLEVLLKDAPRDKLDKLHIYHGKFPLEVDFPDNSFRAMLSSRIFHFLRDVEIEEGLKKIHRWLGPNGKLFCSNCSIHHYSVSKEMLENYNAEEKAGDKWCGRAKSQAQDTSDLFYPFNVPELEKVLPQHGLKVEKIKLYDYPSDIYSDGKGHVGFVATKV